jgi:hypothetical protein
MKMTNYHDTSGLTDEQIQSNGIRALEKLGFTNLEGVDISPNLLLKY